MKRLLLVFVIMMMACTPMQPIESAKPTDSSEPSLIPSTYVPSFMQEEVVEEPTWATKSKEEIKAFRNDFAGGGGYAYDSFMPGRGVAMFAQTAEMAVDMEESAPTAKGADFSQTNVQVAGVDEADVIKTDGTNIYTIADQNVYIIDALPKPTILSTLEFNEYPQNLFVHDNKLTVMGYVQQNYWARSIVPHFSSLTFMKVYDITDPQDPQEIKSYTFEGSYFRARMKDGTVYLFLQDYVQARPEPLPIFFDGEEQRTIPESRIFFWDIPYESPQFIHTHALDLNSLDMESQSMAIEQASELYMSHNNIYLAGREYINEWEIRQEMNLKELRQYVSADDEARITKIQNADADLLSGNEKEHKIANIIQRYYYTLSPQEQEQHNERVSKLTKEELAKHQYREYTTLTRIDLGSLEFKAYGKVPGQINNQFSLDEHNNVLRVATTLNAQWGEEGQITQSQSNVFTLDKDMNLKGSLMGLAKEERIFSTRFMGDRLYMVTFRQIDPFFVIDLKNPENPKVLGELKIPGFSRYLHPYDENHIIGIGRDATLEGRQEGLKISLFEVTNPEQPEEVATFKAQGKYTSSQAEWEHKAFLFDREKELLVIPARSYNEPQRYDGAMVFTINTEAIELRGIVDHLKFQDQERYYSANMQRSLYIDDVLFTKSSHLLRANKLDTLEEVKNLPLAKEIYEIY